MYNVAVIGSRGFDDYGYLKGCLDEIEAHIHTVISGGAIGADTLACRWAVENDKDVEIYKPDYNKYEKIAPLKRNELIIAAADCGVAFWDGKSRGTKYTLDLAEKKDVPFLIYYI